MEWVVLHHNDISTAPPFIMAANSFPVSTLSSFNKTEHMLALGNVENHDLLAFNGQWVIQVAFACTQARMHGFRMYKKIQPSGSFARLSAGVEQLGMLLLWLHFGFSDASTMAPFAFLFVYCIQAVLFFFLYIFLETSDHGLHSDLERPLFFKFI